MVCKFCGNENDDDALFCAICGMKIGAEEVKEEPKKEEVKAEEKKEEPKKEEAKAEEKKEEPKKEEAKAEEKKEEPKKEEVKAEEKKEESKKEVAKKEIVKKDSDDNDGSKKSGNKLVGVLAVVAVLVIIVLVCVLNLKTLDNAVKKMTMKPDNYCQYVLEKETAVMAKTFASSYERGFINSIFSDKCSSEVGVEFEMSDEGADILEDYESDVEWSQIGKVTGTYEVQHKGKLMSSKLKFTAGKKQLLAVDFIVDTENDTAYVGIPSCSDEYMVFELEDFLSRSEIDSYKDTLETLSKIGEINLKPAQVEKLANKYMKIVVSNVKGVKEKQKELKIEGISQKFTALEFDIDSDMAADMMIAVCDELAKDDVIKDYVVSCLEAFDVEDADELYEDEFINALDDLANDLADVDSDETIRVTLYVDSKGDIKATKLSVEDGEIFVGYTTNMGKFGFEFSFTDDGREEFAVKGNGKVSGLTFTGDFDVKSYADKISFSVNKLDLAKAKMGVANGEVSFNLKQFRDMGLPRELKNATLVVKFTGNAGNQDVSAIINNEEGKMVYKLTSYLKASNSSNLSTPASGKQVNVSDMRDVRDFVEDLDFTPVADYLEELGARRADREIDSMIDELKDAYFPAEILYVPMFTPSSVDGGFTAIMAGVMAPQLVKYMSKAKVSSDMQLCDTIRTAVTTALCDPDVIYYDDDYDDILYELKYGSCITDWGKPNGAFEEAVADILGVSNFSELEGKIKSNYSGDGIYVYCENGNQISVEICNTDKRGKNDLSGDRNIGVGPKFY